MRILDLFEGPLRHKQLVLEETALPLWPEQIVKHFELDDEFEQFAKDTQQLAEDLARELQKFTDEGALAAIPDRARTMNALHGKEYATQAQKLLKSAIFSDIFGFEKAQEAYFEANSAFKD